MTTRDTFSFAPAPSAASFIFFTTVRIDTEEPGPDGTLEFRATGFFFTVDVSSDTDGSIRTSTYVVTNRHVVEDATRIELSMLQDDDGRPVPGRDTGYVFPGRSEDGPNWHAHPDPKVDVAIIPLGDLVSRGLEAGLDQPHVSTVRPDNVTPPEVFEQVEVLETVALLDTPRPSTTEST